MQTERNCNSGRVNMKTFNTYKNPYRKEPNLDSIVDQLCTRLQDIKDQEVSSGVGMPTCSLEQNDAIRRYYAAFPALKKGEESLLQYYLPPPAWCRKTEPDNKMQSDQLSKSWDFKKKFSSGKERRNSYHGHKKNKKRCNSYSRSFESKDSLPEWVTHEGVWDMETQDPVKEFIRAIAMDEGYGTCENTVTDEIKEISQIQFRMKENKVPDWDDINLDREWVITEDLIPRARSPSEEELYAKFEAKFDRSIEALWSKDQNTPDDEYQDLPIDIHDLLSSPSDHLFVDPSAEKCSLISLTESIWSNNSEYCTERETPSRMADLLHDHFKPLNLADTEPECPREIQSFSLYEGDEILDVSSIAEAMRSYTAINHSRDHSGFVEVPPRRSSRADRAPAPPERADEPETARAEPPDDLLTSSRTHFRPIRREPDTEAARYVDGDTFDIRGDLDEVEFGRSKSGGVYLDNTRYLEYRASKTIDYSRLNLTEAQRCPDLDDPEFRLRFALRQNNVSVQTDRTVEASWACEECGRSAKKMRPSGMDSIWSEEGSCEACVVALPQTSVPAQSEELSREWEELLSDISAAHAQYMNGDVLEDTLVSADRKRRHSAALRCAGDTGSSKCNHPHARFLHCCAPALDRPLTR